VIAIDTRYGRITCETIVNPAAPWAGKLHPLQVFDCQFSPTLLIGVTNERELWANVPTIGNGLKRFWNGHQAIPFL
jgi:hypothetical protein